MIVPQYPRTYVFQCAMCGETAVAEKTPEGDFYCSDQCFLDSLADWRRQPGAIR